MKRKQNVESLSQLSADEILAVQEMRKRKAQKKEAQASQESVKAVVCVVEGSQMNFSIPTTLECPNCHQANVLIDEISGVYHACPRCDYGKRRKTFGGAVCFKHV